jgi:hypothetical protein
MSDSPKIPGRTLSYQGPLDQEPLDQELSDQIMSDQNMSDRTLSDPTMSDQELVDHTISDQVSSVEKLSDQALSGSVFWTAIESLLNELLDKGPGWISKGLHPTPSYLQPGAYERLFYCHKLSQNLVIARILFRYVNSEDYPIALYCRSVEGDDKDKSKEKARSKELFHANMKALKAVVERWNFESPALKSGTPERPHVC